jgi:hypothetical protein
MLLCILRNDGSEAFVFYDLNHRMSDIHELHEEGVAAIEIRGVYHDTQ